MIYILLDTNIIIDMVVDRRDLIGSKVVDDFIQLLDYGEIRLIVPEIVRTETFRHLDEEFDNVEKTIKDAQSLIGGIHAITTAEKGNFDVRACKKIVNEELKSVLNDYSHNKEKLREGIHETVNKLFEHKNSIVVKDDSFLLGVLKRKIYKRAPFHNKESYGDGVIAETLVNLGDVIEINADDIVFFVTGNYKDFSSPKNRQVLHEDICEDLSEKGIADRVKYICSFAILIKEELRTKVNNVHELDLIAQELAEQEILRMEEWETELNEIEREGKGLSSLGSFESWVEEELKEGFFGQEMEKLDGEFNKIKQRIEDITELYDSLYNIACGISPKDIEYFIDVMESISDECFDSSIEGIMEAMSWIKEQIKNLEELDVADSVDSIEFGGSYRFFSPDKTEYVLSLDELELYPEDGGRDTIDIVLKGMNSDEFYGASVEVVYGYLEEDDDGGIDDAEEEEVYVNDMGIIKKLEELVKEWNDSLDNIDTEAIEEAICEVDK